MTEKTKVIIDTDPGLDDAIALFLAFAQADLDILGITAVNGNVSVEKAEYNARRICEFAWHNDIKVYKGCDRPLKRSVLNAEWMHGVDGLGCLPFPEPGQKCEKKNAVDFIIDTVLNEKDRDITLLCLGPLTNIATAFLKEPKIIRQVREVLIMGGAFCEDGPRGNATPYAEFNILADPHAAEIVFDMAERVTVIPMEVGMQVQADPTYIARLVDLRTRCAEMSVALIHKTQEAMTAQLSDLLKEGIAPETGTAFYDPCAVGCLVRPALFSGKYGTVSVNTDALDDKFAMTTFIEGSKRNCLVTYKVDSDRFKAMLLESLATLS